MRKFIPLLLSLFAINTYVHSQEQVTDDSSPVLKELTSERAMNSKTFLLENGQKQAHIYGGPIHFQENDKWLPINTDIQATLYAAEGYSNSTNVLKTFFPSNAENGQIQLTPPSGKQLSIGTEKTMVTHESGIIKPVNSSFSTHSEAKVKGNVLQYTNIYSGIDDKYEIFEGRLKNAVILKSLPANLQATNADYYGFSEVITLPQGWNIKPTENSSGNLISSSLHIHNEAGKHVLTIPSPVFYDKGGVNDGGTAVHGKYELSVKGNKVELSTLVPVSWLKDPVTTYPVSLDPTVTLAGVDGGWQSNAGTGYVDNAGFVFAGTCCSNGQHRGWAQWDVSSIPDGSCVSDVDVQLECVSTGGTGTETVIINDFTSGIAGPYGAQNNTVFTDLGNGQYTSFTATTTGTYGYYDLGAAADADVAASLTANWFQIGLALQNEPSTDYKNFSATSSNLRVTYGSGSTAPTSASATPSTVCPGNSVTLSQSGGSLGAGASWQWYSGSCGGTAVGTGSSITVTPSSSTTYYVRAESSCGNTVCRSVTVTVNSNSTAPTSASASPNPLCSGTSTTLSVSGGSLGTGANWQWYSGSCGGTAVGSGTSVSVSPTTTTTYYVRAEGSCNITSCASVTVTVNSNSTAPTSASASPNPLCSGTSTTLSVSGGSLGSGANWQWYSGSCGGTAVGSGTSVSVSPTTTTTYYVRAEGTCNTTSCVSVTVTVNTSSTAPTSASASPTSFCSPGSSTLSVSGGSLGTGANWQWYSGSCGGTAVGSGTSVSVSPTTTTTYYVRAEGTCNNTSCVSVTVTVNTSSTAPTSASATPNPLCSGSSTTLSVSGGSLGTGANWQWYSGSCGGTAVGSGTSVSVSPTTTTTYYVRAEGSCNNTSCVSVSVTVNNPSTAPTSASASTNPICSGSSTTLSVSGGSLGTGANWQWYSGSCGGTAVGSGTSVSVSPTTTTTYYVRAEGSCNNTSCVSVTVTVETNSVAATAASATPNPVCSGNSTTLSVSGGTLGTGASWEWYTGSCGGTTAGTGGSISVSPTGTTTYYVRAEGNCNNTTCQSVTVTVDTPSVAPTTISSPSDTICAGSSSTLTVSGGSLGTGANWAWYSGSCGGTSEGSGGNINVSPTTTTTYYVRAEGNCNNTACVSYTLEVVPQGDASWSSPGSVCESAGTVDLSTLVTGTPGGTWSGTSVTGTNFDPTGLSGQSIAITYMVGSSPCQDTLTQTVNVDSAVTADWSGLDSICESDAPINLDQFVTGTTGGTWSGTGVTGSSFDPSGLSGSISIMYSVGSSPCTDDSTRTVNVISAPIFPTASITNDTICTGDTTTVSASGSGGSYNVYDSLTGGSLLGTAPLTVSPSSSTTYYIEAVNGSGCVNNGGRDSVSVTVNPLPPVNGGTSTGVCLGDTITLTASGASTYLWNTGDSTASIAVSPTVTTNYSVVGTDTNGCSSIDTVNIAVQDEGSLAAGDDTASTKMDTPVDIDVFQNDNGDVNTITIMVPPNSGSASNNGNGEINYSPNNGFEGEDSLVYEICNEFCANLCTEATVTITVENDVELSVPEGLSPNGDGYNDVFKIIGLENYPDNSLVIYNRWGDLVFEAAPYENDWNGGNDGSSGIRMGDQVVEGTYYFILKLGEGEDPVKGFVELRKGR